MRAALRLRVDSAREDKGTIAKIIGSQVLFRKDLTDDTFAMTPSDRLASIRAKIERANHHIRELEARLDDLDHYRLVIENDPQSLERIYRVVPIGKIPVELSLICGDAIHNLRSALDHLACHLVAANGNSVGRNIQFPIRQVAPKGKMRDSAEVQGVCTKAIDLIESLQPYCTGIDDLWKLHQLDIDDKHKLLLVVGYVNQAASVSLMGPGPNSGAIRFDMTFVGPIPDDGAELGRIGAGVISDEMQDKFDFSFEIAFTETKVADGDPALPLLHKLLHFVDGIIQQFAAYL